MNNLEEIYTQLHATVALLASPAETQIAYLAQASEQAKSTVLADDIAEDLCHWVMCAPQLTEGPSLNGPTLEALRMLDSELAAVGANVADWTPAALAASSKWENIRQHAAKVLAAMDEYYPAGASDALPSGIYIPAGRD